jgi:hypothetical protein
MKAVSIALFLLTTQAFAAGSPEKWTGTGSVFTPEGQRLEGYRVDVENTRLGAGVIQSDVTLTLDDGTKRVTSQKLTFKGSKWLTESTVGKGGGACYGLDLCENRISDGAGREFATTIINDGSFARRNVTFELENGKPVRVLRDQVVKLTYR